NGLLSRPSPGPATALFTNQITGPATFTVTVTGALFTPGPGQPVSLMLYVNVTAPLAPGGGSKSNVPVPVFTFEMVPPAGDVALTLAASTVNEVETHPLTPLSVASEAPASSPVKPTIFMLACAEYVFGKLTTSTVGGSLTALIVMVNDCVADASIP